MNVKDAPIVLRSPGHCCACSVICHHIGPAVFCGTHRPQPLQVIVPESTVPMWPYNVWTVTL